MRPLELHLAHFGPYGEAVLNFEALNRLFLVCGPTGAGKTTLFDALTYALYERTPGTRGDLGEQLASHHAPEGAIPSVSLRFSLGNQQWRIARTLRHRVKKQRGEGYKDQEPTALLEVLKDHVWETWTGKRSEINQKLEDLIGLSAEEFAKIVVLPQGDFQQFLEASSSEREKMLQKLFPVELYERLADGVKGRAKVVEEARKHWEDRWQDLVARLGSAPDERPELEAALAQAQALALQAAQLEASTSEALITLKGLHADWQVLLLKKAEQQSWEQKRPQMDADRARIDKAQKARPLGTDLDRQAQILSEGLSLRAVQDRAKLELDGVEKGLAEVKARAADNLIREARLVELLKERGALEQQLKLWTDARTWEASEAKAAAEETRTAEVHRTAHEARSAAESALPPEPKGPGLQEALNQVESARIQHEAEIRRASLTVSLAAETDTFETAAAAAASADQEAALWSQVVEALKAASLAQTLQPHQPCPVCGSTQHPAPALWPEASAEAPARLKEALIEQSRCQKALAVSQDRQAALSLQLTQLPPQAIDDYQSALAHLQSLQSWMTERDRVRAIVETRTSEETFAWQAWQSATKARELLSQKRQSLAQNLTTDPGPQLEALKLEEIDLRRRLDEDRKKLEMLGRDQSTLTSRVSEQEKQLETQRQEYAKLQDRLSSAVTALGWAPEELKTARLDESILLGLEQRVVAFDRETHRLAGETDTLEAKFHDGEPGPLAPLADALEDHRRDRQLHESAAKEREFALRERDRLEEELREVSREKQALESDFQRLVPLAKTLDGSNPLNLRLTTWVLVQALEQVAASATHRLSSMSSGRYALKVQSQGSDGRKNWGLDLAVVDSYTGQERAVGTLSGGEKFMTSISLALGLADVIQERAGGLKLEAIFIDEGFGTLDDQSLDRAMAILHDLGQHRSVGLISHVAELRQRISSRIEVVKGKNGSWLKVE